MLCCIKLTMSYYNSFSSSDEYRREELKRKIEHALSSLTLEEFFKCEASQAPSGRRYTTI